MFFFSTMQLLFWFVFLILSPVELDCKYVPLIHILDMKNPVIVGTTDDFKSRELFVLMKDVMRLNQTICLTTSFKNNTLPDSPGIIFISYEHKIADLHGQKSS